nr:hypothetical protein [Tanacetum cinerariifolium]
MLRVFPITLTGAAKRYCPPSKTAKQLEDICSFNQEGEKTLYQAWERPFPNNNINDDRFNRGASGYDQSSSGERRPSLTKIINKYMEKKAKRHAEQDKWLKEFYQNTDINREAHDKIIQGFSDNEKQETDKPKIEGALAALEAKLEIKKVPQEDKKCVSYYVEPYEPPIPFPRRLKHHVEEVLIHETMESLKKIKINRPLLKEIRFNFNNALVDLGASISIMPLSMYKRLGIGKLEPINMMIEMADNTKCTPNGLVENLLVKINKLIFPVDFVILNIVEDIKIPIILGRTLLATTHAKVDIFRKLISLEVGNEKVIFKIRSSFDLMIFKFVCSIKSITCSENDDLNKMYYDLFLYETELCEFNHLLAIEPDIFTYDIEVQESYEEVVYRMTKQEDPWKIKKMDEANLERHQDLTPVEKPTVHWCRAIPQGKEYECEYWASCNPYSNVCDEDTYRKMISGLSLSDWMKIRYRKVCKMTMERILKDHWRKRFDEEEDDIEENSEDPKEWGEDKANILIGVIYDKLNNDWFNGISKDEDDLEGILDYLEPSSYDGFIDLDNEAYIERRCRLLGLTYVEPPDFNRKS